MVRFWQTLIFAFVAAACVSGSGDFRSNGRHGSSVEVSKTWSQFKTFQMKFDRKYASKKEALERFEVFSRNMEKIKKLNAMEKGTAKYGINEMADWTEEEFLKRRANLSPEGLLERLDKTRIDSFRDDDNQTVPDSKDWRKEGKVSPVKNQGRCGSCWAFSVTGCVESSYAIKENTTAPNLSEQQLVDCDPKSEGCDGGWPESAIDYIIDAGGMEGNATYPYTGKDGNCSFPNGSIVARVTEKITLQSGNETEMKRYIGLMGPTSCAVNANLLQFYSGGIIYPSFFFCLPLNQTLNHAVVAVGYETDMMGRDYWILKNSWGEDWGEKGYARMLRDYNTCGIANVVDAVHAESPQQNGTVTVKEIM